jgi:hypothetical protein
MCAVKTVHHPKRVRNFSRYKRLILASLISAVLLISIFCTESFLPTALSDSGGSSGSFEIYVGNATMTNVSFTGPCIYNSTGGQMEVTNVTADVANLSEMLLVKDGSRLELEAPNAFSTKLTFYTTYLSSLVDFDNWVEIEIYGNTTVDLSIPQLCFTNASMVTVYMQAESFSAPWLSLTST